MELSPETLQFIIKLVKDESGISLSESKTYLIESRLSEVVRKHQFESINDLVAKIMISKDKLIIKEIVDAMTTNESSFFRDSTPFERFTKVVIPRILEKKPGQEKIRIWSAACSTGQEPYSLSITIKENFANLSTKFEIIASDLSEMALKKAQDGIYSQFEIQRGMPIQLLLKYFKQVDKSWQLNDDIRQSVKFMSKNLMDDIFFAYKFDVIFCRNVLIYFDSETKVKVLNNLCKCLDDNGVLYTGSSETVIGLETVLKLLDPLYSGIYVLSNNTE